MKKYILLPSTIYFVTNLAKALINNTRNNASFAEILKTKKVKLLWGNVSAFVATSTLIRVHFFPSSFILMV